MYVMVESGGHVLAFGPTPKKTRDDFIRRDIWYDGPPLEIRRCSPALYRRLRTLDRNSVFLFFCRINRKGVAVCPKAMPKASYRPKG